MSTAKPDIIIPFIYNLEEVRPCVVIYVRPQTNKLNYEKAIILACQQYGEIVYLANIGGKIFIDNLLILEHYATQYLFAMHSKSIIAEYPEMIKKIEQHFNLDFQKIDIISPFDAILKLKITSAELFNTIVDECDFLRIYGQTIKKIGDCFVINYDIPEIIAEYTPQTNVFTCAAILKEHSKITDLNQAIFDNLKTNDSTPIIDKDIYKAHKWFETVKRTYHISYNHVAAMFDMKDFVFSAKGDEIDFTEIPLASHLINSGILTCEDLLAIKRFSLVYINDDNGEKKLINIQEEAKNMTLEECIELFKKIDYSKIRK